MTWKAWKKNLKKTGWVMVRSNKHEVWKHEAYGTVTCSKTASDCRSLLNNMGHVRTLMRRAGVQI